MTISYPSEEKLNKLDRYEDNFNIHVSKQLKTIMALGGVGGRCVSSGFINVAESTIGRYARTGYHAERCLHVVAAVCWKCRAGISSVLIGENDFSHYWENAELEVLEAMTYCGAMGTREFSSFANDLINSIAMSEDDRRVFCSRIDSLGNNRIEDVLAPDVVDMNLFRSEYYRSVSESLRSFRIEYGFSIEMMARALGVTEGKYRRYESVKSPVRCVPMYTAARFKMAFNVPSAVNFLTSMDQYGGAATMRAIQQGREEIVYEILKRADKKSLTTIKSNAKALAHYSLTK